MLVDFDVLGWAVGVGALIVVLFLLWVRGRGWPHLFCFSVFWVYLLLVVKVVFFPIPISGGMAEAMRSDGEGLLSSVNLVMGRFAPYGGVPVRQVVCNILLAVPFGFGLPFLARVSWRRVLWLAPAFGVFVEGAQFLVSLGLGFPYRATDVNDVILNGWGVVIGYAVFRLFSHVFLSVARVDRAHDPGRLVSYLEEVVRRSSGVGSERRTLGISDTRDEQT